MGAADTVPVAVGPAGLAGSADADADACGAGRASGFTAVGTLPGAAAGLDVSLAVCARGSSGTTVVVTTALSPGPLWKNSKGSGGKKTNSAAPARNKAPPAKAGRDNEPRKVELCPEEPDE